MTVTPARTSAQNTHTPTTRSAERRALEDAVNLGAIGLDWLGAVLHAIEVLSKQKKAWPHIKTLAELGQYITVDFADLLDSEREKLATYSNAGEGQANDAR